MNILVTGGFGFIGSHLVEALVRKGHKVRLLDNRHGCHYQEEAFSDFIKGSPVDLMSGDITDLKTCMRGCAGADAVFHTAAVVLIRESYENPRRAFAINVQGTENLLKAAVYHNVEKFVFSSTGKIYGNNEELISMETSLPCPTTPYAKTKMEAECLVSEYAANYGLTAVSLRYFSVYGPRMKLFGGLIGDILRNVMDGGAIKLNARPDMERDFTYIDDAVEANLLCLENLVSGYEAVNIGCGASKTVHDLVHQIQGILHKKYEVIYADLPEGTVLKTRADITKARTMFGYAPKFHLGPGLEKTINWIMSHSILEMESSGVSS